MGEEVSREACGEKHRDHKKTYMCDSGAACKEKLC